MAICEHGSNALACPDCYRLKGGRPADPRTGAPAAAPIAQGKVIPLNEAAMYESMKRARLANAKVDGTAPAAAQVMPEGYRSAGSPATWTVDAKGVPQPPPHRSVIDSLPRHPHKATTIK